MSKQFDLKLAGIALILFFMGMVVVSNVFGADLDCTKEPYDREKFEHWVKSEDPRFKDIRQEMIWEHVVEFEGVKAGRIENGKVVEALYYDHYTGKNYLLSENKPDMEHIISLKAAWIRNACNWTDEKRREFANAKINLLPVNLSANRKKSADGIAEYMPPNVHYCIPFLDRSREIMEQFGLKPFKRDVRAYKIMYGKCEKWKNGIEIDQIAGWLKRKGLSF